MQLRPAGPDELRRIGAWLTDPKFWADAFLLPARPDPSWVESGMLIIKDGPRLELVQARFHIVHDEDRVVGFAIDYCGAYYDADFKYSQNALEIEAVRRSPF